MTNVVYPYDDTGRASTNLIRGEVQVLTVINNDPFRYFIPEFAPFYETNLYIEGQDALGSPRPLIRGVDYNVNLSYIGATRANGNAVWGGITIINNVIQGPIKVTYQTIGGKYAADRNYVVQSLAEHNYNPRVVSWDQLTNLQETFPPSNHPQDLDTFTGYKDLIDAINNYQTSPDEFQILKDLIWRHTLDHNDPHKTKDLLSEYALKEDVRIADEHLQTQIGNNRQSIDTNATEIINAKMRIGAFEARLNWIQNNFQIVEEVPSAFMATLLIVKKPHLRYMVWDDIAKVYIRAPWDQAGIITLHYNNPGILNGHLPVRGDLQYNQADYPDLAKALGLSGTGTFSLLELRGEFIRVLDNGRSVDANRVVGSYQQGSLVGGYDDNTGDAHMSVLGGGPQRWSTDNYQASDYGIEYVRYATVPYKDFPSTAARQWYGVVRPRNVAFSGWVRY